MSGSTSMEVTHVLGGWRRGEGGGGVLANTGNGLHALTLCSNFLFFAHSPPFRASSFVRVLLLLILVLPLQLLVLVNDVDRNRNPPSPRPPLFYFSALLINAPPFRTFSFQPTTVNTFLGTPATPPSWTNGHYFFFLSFIYELMDLTFIQWSD